jgi:flagellar biosynthesis GTPase FlhF
MQFLELVRGIFTLSNSFIALFIVIYAYLFLKKTTSHKERRPWDYLFVASIIYLGYTVLTTLITYDVGDIGHIDLEALNVFFQFLYTGLILLAFISQTDLIFRNEIIIITRKMEAKERVKLGAKIEKDLTREDNELKKDTLEIKKKEEEIKEATDEIKKEEKEIREKEDEIKQEAKQIETELKKKSRNKERPRKKAKKSKV